LKRWDIKLKNKPAVCSGILSAFSLSAPARMGGGMKGDQKWEMKQQGMMAEGI